MLADVFSTNSLLQYTFDANAILGNNSATGLFWQQKSHCITDILCYVLLWLWPKVHKLGIVVTLI